MHAKPRNGVVAALILIGLRGSAPALASNSCQQGYRQQSLISDFALGRDWVVYASCTHPERPSVALLVGQPLAEGSSPFASAAVPAIQTTPATLDATSFSTPGQPMVSPGSDVRVWLSSSVAQIELSAVALENGVLGSAIRVRAIPGGKILYGTVRGPGSVELLASGFSGPSGAGR